MEPAADKTLIWEEPAAGTPAPVPASPGTFANHGGRAGVFAGFVGALVVTVIFSAIGLWYLGLLFALVALALGLLWSNAVLHVVEGPLERAMVRTTDNLWASARLTRASLSSWTRAGKQELRLRTEQYALQREHDRTLRALGEAVYRGDTARAEKLRLDAVSTGNKIALCGDALRIARASATRRVEAERSAVAPTQTITAVPRRRRPRRPTKPLASSLAPPAPEASARVLEEPTDSWW